MIFGRRFYLAGILLLSSGCTQKLFKASVMKRNDLKTNVYLPPIANGSQKEVLKDCFNYYFIFPSKSSWDREALYKNICPKSDHLLNVELERRYYLIPLIFGEDRLILKAECAQ